jgi:hypothetical protein
MSDPDRSIKEPFTSKDDLQTETIALLRQCLQHFGSLVTRLEQELADARLRERVEETVTSALTDELADATSEVEMTLTEKIRTLPLVCEMAKQLSPERTEPCDATCMRKRAAALVEEAAEASLAAQTRELANYQGAFSPCALHQPDRWEGDGTCVVCEGTVASEAAAQWRDQLAAAKDEATALRAALNEALKWCRGTHGKSYKCFNCDQLVAALGSRACQRCGLPRNAIMHMTTSDGVVIRPDGHLFEAALGSSSSPASPETTTKEP